MLPPGHSRKSSPASAGFSLVELLIAVTLLSMVSFIGTYAYNTYSQYWQREVGNFSSTFSRSRGLTLFYQTIADVHPYILPANNDGQHYHYFEGGQSQLRSVRASGLSNRVLPAYFEIELSQDGQLLYREHSITKDSLYSAPPREAEPDLELVLMNDVDELVFEYFGFSHFRERFSNVEGDSGIARSIAAEPRRQWYGFYSGRDTLITPEVVQVTLTINGERTITKHMLRDIIEKQLQFVDAGAES